MNFDEMTDLQTDNKRPSDPINQRLEDANVKQQAARQRSPATSGAGYLQQAEALSPRKALIDPITGKQVGTYLDFEGVIQVFDKSGQIIWMDELPIQSSIGPLDLIFAVRGIVAAAGVGLKAVSKEVESHQRTGRDAPIEERIPDEVWAVLRGDSG